MNHFLPIAHMDTSYLVASLMAHMEMFDHVTLRQTYPGTAHKDTRTIYLRGPKLPPAAWFEDVEHIDYAAVKELPEAAISLSSTWACMHGLSLPRHPRIEPAYTVRLERIAKAMIVELKPGGVVQWHRDEGPYADKHHRFHLPLVTNPNCLLISGCEHLHVPVGQLTWFDNHVMHSAVNFGTTPRYHLIVDYRIAE